MGHVTSPCYICHLSTEQHDECCVSCHLWEWLRSWSLGSLLGELAAGTAVSS